MKSVPTYYFVAMDVARDDSDVIGAQMFDLGAQGVEERDEGTLVQGAPGKVTLVGSFENQKAANAAKKSLGKRARIEELVGDEWRDAWKEHFRPFRLCEGVWIKPPWETHDARKGETVLELEPGRAFGTGLHETTRLVAQAIGASRGSLSRSSILDVGTGSGILALVALALGAREAIGVDTDADAIAVANENATRNKMTKRVKFATTPIARVRGEFQLVLANIEADVLMDMKDALLARIASVSSGGGRLVMSGILQSRERDVKAVFGKPLSRASIGEWVSLTYAR